MNGSTTRRVLGIATRIESDMPALGALADRAFAAWPPTRAAPVLRVRLRATPGREPTPPTACTYDVGPSGRLVIRGPGLRIRVDAARGRAAGRIAEALLEHPAHLRYAAIEAATLFMLTQHDRVPFHAAAIARDGHALLIAGPSGAGKSTLAWAAVQHGWRLLSEDCVYLESARPRIWGWPGFLHLDPDAARFFPELRGRAGAILANGKRKIALAAPPCGPAWARTAALCILARTQAGPRLDAVPVDDAIASLTDRLEPGFDRFAEVTPAALVRVIHDAWRLDVGPDPRAAMPVLERITRDG